VFCVYAGSLGEEFAGGRKQFDLFYSWPIDFAICCSTEAPCYKVSTTYPALRHTGSTEIHQDIKHLQR